MQASIFSLSIILSLDGWCNISSYSNDNFFPKCSELIQKAFFLSETSEMPIRKPPEMFRKQKFLLIMGIENRQWGKGKREGVSNEQSMT